MCSALAFVMIVCLTGPATGTELGNRVPLKSSDHVFQNPIYDGREGGETIFTAVPIPSLPFTDTGATCDNINDYDEVCPYSGSVSPDVVYSYSVPNDMGITVDLCGSGYDTKVYILDENLNVLACNDDFYSGAPCGAYVSRIEDAPIPGGHTIYIVIDGYGGDCGQYTMEVSTVIGTCYWGACPPGSVLEGEPEIMDGYQDAYNGGCNSPEFGSPFQSLEAFEPGGHLTFCGKGGWYDDGFRDTDWFTVILDPEGTGVLECRLCGEFGTYLFQLDLPNCDQVSVIQSALSQWQWAELTIVGAPGDVVWLWVGSATYYPPSEYSGHEYEYILELDGLQGPVATERQTWSEVKSLFR